MSNEKDLTILTDEEMEQIAGGFAEGNQGEVTKPAVRYGVVTYYGIVTFYGIVIEEPIPQPLYGVSTSES